VKKNIETFKNASVVWTQEEPMNQGAWNFVYHHIRTSATAANRPIEPQYVGRAPSASTATGKKTNLLSLFAHSTLRPTTQSVSPLP